MNGSAESSEDMAALWVARMDAEQWSTDDEAALQQWLRESATNRGLLLHAQAAWLAGDQLRDGLPFPNLKLPTAEQHRWRRRAVIGGLAATVVAIAGRFAVRETELNYATKLGEIRRVPLSDGSVITINSATALNVRLEARLRRVDMVQGEAWFEVAKDLTRPFVVAAGRIQAQAVGTAFSVRLRNEAAEILVTEGVVEAWVAGGAPPRSRITAGQIAFVSEDAPVARAPEQASSVDRALAWRSGIIDLQGETLADASEEFNRYNERKLVIGDPNIAGEQFDGVFRINDPEGFALAVQSSLNVPVDSTDPALIRIGR